MIERDGQPLAVLIHDPALQYNPGLVDSVCAVAGLSLDNERLAAELRARLVELQASRARLVTAADEARRRIERNLHDGAQQQLVALRISLGLARQLVASSPAEAAVYFCVLEALQNTAKYAHASAARITLGHSGQELAFTVEDDGQGFDPASTPKGTGLQGISDRLAALGGTIAIVSAPGHGTRVTGRLPVPPGQAG